MIRTKICIVGAGPAGATLSHFLSKEKIDHVLVDKASFPRDKVCGDGISLDVLHTLNRISPDLLEKFSVSKGMMPSGGFCFHAPNGKEMRYDFSNDGFSYWPFFTSRRADFDNFLIDNLPLNFLTFLPEHKVTNIVRSDGGFRVEIEGSKEAEIQCDYIIGAEGEKPIVTRFLGIKHFREKEHLMGALRVYYKGVEGFHENKHLEFFFDQNILPGYFWIFPLNENEANVGLGMASSAISKGKVNLKQKLAYIIEHHPKISPMFKNAEPLEKPVGWGLPAITPKRQIAGDGFALIGDAAGMVDPFNGKGIGPGMVSARILSEHLVEAIRNKDKNFMPYQNHMYKYYKTEIKTGYLLRSIMVKPWVISMAASFMNIKPVHNAIHQQTVKYWKKWI